MKNNYALVLCAVFVLAFAACKKDDVKNVEKQENQFVRLLVADDAGGKVTLIDPRKNTQDEFSISGASFALYATASKRFAAVVNGAGNKVDFFDSGIEAHDDHAHIKGTPKWGLTTATATKPTHFYAWENQIAIFNDGEGSISTALESELHTKAGMEKINTGAAHHGAMVIFNNGTYAVTHKDGSIAGTLPEKVKVISASGSVLHQGNIATKGIHGDAGNGVTALFGAPEGILKITATGTESLITYPADFGTNWLSGIYYGKASQQFIGLRAKFGVFIINEAGNAVETLYKSATLKSAAFDAAGKNVLVLEEDGTLHIFDAASKTEKAVKKLGLTFPTTGGPAYTATAKYVYVTNPEAQAIHVLNTEDLSEARKITITGKPGKIVMIGADLESDEH